MLEDNEGGSGSNATPLTLNNKAAVCVDYIQACPHCAVTNEMYMTSGHWVHNIGSQMAHFKGKVN